MEEIFFKSLRDSYYKERISLMKDLQSTFNLSFTEVKDLLIIIELGKITESLDELRKALYNLDSQFGTMLKEQMESISSNISDVQDSINFFKE